MTDQSPPVEMFHDTTRRIHLFTEVSEESAAAIIRKLQYFSVVDMPITMYLNSPGGSLSHGMAIIDAMLATGCVINTVVVGEACSMAAIIHAYGTPGHRYMTKNSYLMYHPVSYALGHDYQKFQDRTVEFNRRNTNHLMTEFYARLGLKKKDQINAFVKEIDTSLWLQAREAIKRGYADGLWTQRHENALNQQKFQIQYVEEEAPEGKTE